MNNTNIKSKIISPQKIIGTNAYMGISPLKETYNNIMQYQTNNSTVIPLEQDELNDDFDENKFMEEQKPLNIINYIAKKLVSSSFCRSFNLQYGSAKKFTAGRVPSANTTSHNHIISKGFYNRDSNPINEEIEYLNENSDNYIDNNEIDNDKNDLLDNNYYFKNLISILNQKFKKYALNYENQEKNSFDESKTQNIINTNDTNIKLDLNKKFKKNQKPNIITINNQKTKKISIDKPYFLNKNNILNNNTSKNIGAKKIKFKEDSDFKSLDNKKNRNINKNLSPKNNNIETITYNIKDMTTHYNNFLDISTNYDPGIDSKVGSSVERTDSFTNNELKNFSLSLDKTKKKENGLKKNRYKENGAEETYKTNKNKNIFVNSNKNNKNKYLPFYEKKVSINLSNTFSNLSKSENKTKKK